MIYKNQFEKILNCLKNAEVQNLILKIISITENCFSIAIFE